jgi:rsbT co-antagonist protein RsbR
VANRLVGAARAARLLGARVVLTGISPNVAQTLVQLDADLSGIATLSTLQSGIAYALGR